MRITAKNMDDFSFDLLLDLPKPKEPKIPDDVREDVEQWKKNHRCEGFCGRLFCSVCPSVHKTLFKKEQKTRKKRIPTKQEERNVKPKH